MKDYDKEPLVIEDNNAIFAFLYGIIGIVAMVFVYIFNPGNASQQSLNVALFIGLPMFVVPSVIPYIKSRKKRKIILKNNKINFMQENLIVEELDLTKEFKIYKSFEHYYHKSQKPPLFIITVWYILLPITILHYILTIVTKFLYNLFRNKLKDYKFFDCIILIQGDKVINILPNSNEEYMQVVNYFKSLKIDILNNKKIFYNKFHFFEKINYEELENEQTRSIRYSR